jgi:hypothetical protein
MKFLSENGQSKMINFFNKILNFFINLKKKKETIIRLNEVKLLNGKILAEMQKKIFYPDLNDSEFKVFSQFGEDGIIQYLINNLKISNKKFIEFGVENYDEANTRFLLENNNWSGLIIEGNQKNINYIKKQNYYWRYDLTAVNAFVSIKNINDLIRSNYFEGNIGLLSIDIDGNDYWVLEEINVISPDIIIIEYNANFGPNKSLTIKYNENFQRAKSNIGKLIYGCSLTAANNLCKKKGYSLVCTNKNGNNAFFVKTKLLNEKIKEKTVGEVFQINSFKEYCGSSGIPSKISSQQNFEINNSPLVQEV